MTVHRIRAEVIRTLAGDLIRVTTCRRVYRFGPGPDAIAQFERVVPAPVRRNVIIVVHRRQA